MNFSLINKLILKTDSEHILDILSFKFFITHQQLLVLLVFNTHLILGLQLGFFDSLVEFLKH